MEILPVIFTLLISIGIPVGALIYYIAKQRSRVIPYLLGVVTFLVFQYLTRIPLLQLLSAQGWFVAFALANPIVYSVLLGFTAGLFEEGGRFIVMKLFMKNRTAWGDGLAHGIGHGGFEAATLVGINYIVALIVTPQALLGAGAGVILLAGLERAAAMSFHIGASVLVLRGIRLKRPWYLLIAIGLHTLLDAPLGILQQAGFGIMAIEGYVFVFGAAMLVYTFLARAKEKRETMTLQTEGTNETPQ